MPSISPKIGEPPQQLPSLPGAQAEANAIASLLNTKAITGSSATKSPIVQQMLKARMIHLATHGLLDDFKGQGVPGAIALAPSGNDNGLLTSSEILDLKLNAELVVLLPSRQKNTYFSRNPKAIAKRCCEAQIAFG